VNIAGQVTRTVAALPSPLLLVIAIVKRSRFFGLAAETGFWITFTLPWIALGVLSSIGVAARYSDPSTVATVQAEVVSVASRVLTPEAVNSFLLPLLDQISSGGTEVGLLGIVIALWSGSRMVAALTVGVAVINGQTEHSGYARNRGLGLLLYLAGLVAAGIAVALMALGPDRLPLWWGGGSMLLSYSLVGLVVIGLLVLLFQTALPVRARLHNDVLGAGVALVGWVIGSIGLHFYTDHLFSNFNVYAALATPVAVMLWSYVSAVAVFVGATVACLLQGRVGVEVSEPTDPVHFRSESARDVDFRRKSRRRP